MNMPSSPSDIDAVDRAIATRRSVRGFLPTPVPLDMVEDILSVAARAPSGTNTRPWRVTVLTGEAKTTLSAKIRGVMEHIGAPDSEMFVCGMSLCHADKQAVANRLVTEREPVAGFARFLS